MEKVAIQNTSIIRPLAMLWGTRKDQDQFSDSIKQSIKLSHPMTIRKRNHIEFQLKHRKILFLIFVPMFAFL